MPLRTVGDKKPKETVQELETKLREALATLQTKFPEDDTVEKLQAITEDFFTIPCADHHNSLEQAGEWQVLGADGHIIPGQATYPGVECKPGAKIVLFNSTEACPNCQEKMKDPLDT